MELYLGFLLVISGVSERIVEVLKNFIPYLQKGTCPFSEKLRAGFVQLIAMFVATILVGANSGVVLELWPFAYESVYIPLLISGVITVSGAGVINMMLDTVALAKTVKTDQVV